MTEYVNRQFFGGVANGRTIAIPSDLTLFSVPQEFQETRFYRESFDARMPEPPHNYSLRQVVDPSGKPRIVMVLSTISDKHFIELLNAQLQER